MRKAAAKAIGLSLTLLLLTAQVALAHGGSGGEGIAVEPESVTAGQTVILAGEGLEPDSDRVLVLVGGDLTVSFGTVTTDADGAFSSELAIPSYLPSGAYEIQAIGDETLTTPLAVTAAAGGAQVTPDASDPTEMIVSRDRGPLELGLIIAAVVAAAAAGVLLVWKAERFRSAG